MGGGNCGDIACIEAYAIWRAIVIGARRAQWEIGRKNCKHRLLMIITDRPAIVGEFISMSNRGLYIDFSFDRSSEPLSFKLMVNNTLMSISRAVQHFKYVCIVSRDTIPAQAEIGKNDWVPHRMAARGCYEGRTYVRCMCSGYMPFNFRIMDVTRCVIPGRESEYVSITSTAMDRSPRG